MNTLTFSVFADLHHVPDAFCTFSERKLTEIQQRAKEKGSAFIIHAGDLTHGPSQYMDFVNRYLDFEIPSYSCLGNHDSDNTSFEETLKAYRMPNDYYYFDTHGFRIVVLNLNYYEQDGEYIPYSLGNYYSTTGSVGMMPPKEMEWLREILDSSPYPCILIAHQSIEREADGILNKEEVREIINEANRKHKNRVMMFINGHYHRDYMALKDNVLYFDLNSASYDWLENPHNFYSKELMEQYSVIQHTVFVNEGIHAVITVTDEGEINIEGMEGTYYDGITREMTDNPPYDPCGRPATAKVSSAHIKLL